MSRGDWRRMRAAVLANALRLAQRGARLARARVDAVIRRRELTPGETGAAVGVAGGAVLALVARKPSLFWVSLLLAVLCLAVYEEDQAARADARREGEGWPQEGPRSRRAPRQGYPSNGPGAERNDWARAGLDGQPTPPPQQQPQHQQTPAQQKPPRRQASAPPRHPEAANPQPAQAATPAPAQADMPQGPWMASLLREVASVQDDVAAVAEGVRAGASQARGGVAAARSTYGATACSYGDGEQVQGWSGGGVATDGAGRGGVDGAGAPLSEQELLLARLLSLNTKLRHLSSKMAGEVEAASPTAAAAATTVAGTPTPSSSLPATGTVATPTMPNGQGIGGAVPASQDALPASALQARVEELEMRITASVRKELEDVLEQWTSRSTQAISGEVAAKLEKLGAKLGGLEGAVRKAVEQSVAEAAAASSAAPAGASDAERTAAFAAEMDRMCERLAGLLRRDLGLMLEPVAALPALLTRHYAEEGSRMTVEMVKEMERMRDTAVASGSRALDAAVQQLSAANGEQVEGLLRQQRRQQVSAQEEMKALGALLATVAEGVKATREGASSLPAAVADSVESRMGGARANWVQEIAQLMAQRDKAVAADAEVVRASLKSLHSTLAALAVTTGELRAELAQGLAKDAARRGPASDDAIQQGVSALQGAVSAIDVELGTVSSKVGALVASLEEMSAGLTTALKSGTLTTSEGASASSRGTALSASDVQASVTEGVRAGMRDMLAPLDALQASLVTVTSGIANVSSMDVHGGAARRAVDVGDGAVMSLLTSAVSRLEAAVQTLNACIGDVGEESPGAAPALQGAPAVVEASGAVAGAATGQRVALLPLLAALSSLLPALEQASASAGSKEAGAAQTQAPTRAANASLGGLGAPATSMVQPPSGVTGDPQARAATPAVSSSRASGAAVEGKASPPPAGTASLAQASPRDGLLPGASASADVAVVSASAAAAGRPSSMARPAGAEGGDAASSAPRAAGGLEPSSQAAIASIPAMPPATGATTRASTSDGDAPGTGAVPARASPTVGTAAVQPAPGQGMGLGGSGWQAPPPPRPDGRPSLPRGRPDMFREEGPPTGAGAGARDGMPSNRDMRRAAAQQEAVMMEAAQRRRQQSPPPPYQQQAPPGYQQQPPHQQQPPRYQQQPPPAREYQPPPQRPRPQMEDGNGGWGPQSQGALPPQEVAGRDRVARADSPSSPAAAPSQATWGGGAAPSAPGEYRRDTPSNDMGRGVGPEDGVAIRQPSVQGAGDRYEGRSTSGGPARGSVGQAPPDMARPRLENEREAVGQGAGPVQGSRGLPWEASSEAAPRVPARGDRGGAPSGLVSSDGRLTLKVVGEEELRLFLAEGAKQLALAREMMSASGNSGAGGSSGDVPTSRIVEVLDNAAVLFSRAADVAPGSVLAFGQWGNCLLASGQVKVGVVQQLRATQAAMRTQAQARGASVPAGEASELASALAQVEREAEEALVLAGRKFRVAMGLDSRDERALYNWGLALCFRAKLMGRQRATEAENLYKAAIEKFQAALSLNSDLNGALMNWGVALRDCATLHDPGNPRRATFLELARKRFTALLDRQPDNAAAATAYREVEAELAAEYERQAVGNPGMSGAARRQGQRARPSLSERGSIGGPGQDTPVSNRGAPRDGWEEQQAPPPMGRKQGTGPGRRSSRDDDRSGGGPLSRIRRP